MEAGETTTTTAPVVPTGSATGSSKDGESSPRPDGGRGSPPPHCAICLGTCQNKSFTNSCLHQFCFNCLLTWSKVKAECPLCKQNFKSIIHNVRSNHQYEEYRVEGRQTEQIDTIELTNSFHDIFHHVSSRRFRYRTTMTLPRSDSIAIQQLLLNYPMILPDVVPIPSPPPPPRSVPARRRREPASFRRFIYRHNLWARPLPDFTGRYRECSPEFYRFNDAQIHRLVPWLNRDLGYLLNENPAHISYVMTIILELLKESPISSAQFAAAIRRFFGERTEHFLHELHNFASTPYDMTGYDRNVQYDIDPRVSTVVNEMNVISSSDDDGSVDSDIVMVSSSEPTSTAGPSRIFSAIASASASAPAPVYPPNFIPNLIPPNHSLLPNLSNSIVPIETISHSDTDESNSEVLFNGYIKPPEQRTPEVVDLLGSDSDVILQENSPPSFSTNLNVTPQMPSVSRSVPGVKLILKRHRENKLCADFDTDSDGSWFVQRRRKRNRRRSFDSATTLDTRRSTPESNWSSKTFLSRGSDSDIHTPSSAVNTHDEFTDDEGKLVQVKHTSKVKTKGRSRSRKHRKTKSSRSKSRSRSGGHSRIKSSKHSEDKYKDKHRKKSKSKSGKDVKSSKKSSSERSALNERDRWDEPGTSGMGTRNSSREHESEKPRHPERTLRSVMNTSSSTTDSNDRHLSTNEENLLNLMNSATLNPNGSVLSYNSDSGSIPSEDRSRLANLDQLLPIMQQADNCFNTRLSVYADSDPEDNLPLNLAVNKRQ